MPFQELYVQRIYFTNKQDRGCKAIVTYNSSIIKKDVTAFVCRRACLPAGSRLYIAVYPANHRTTTTMFPPVNVHDSFLFGPLFHHNDQGAPLFRRPRDCAVKNVISEWCFHRILLRLTCSPSSSRRATTIVSFSRRKKNYAAALLPQLEPVEYIAGVVRLWKSRANLNIYIPGVCTYLTRRIFLSRESCTRAWALSKIVECCDSRIIWRVVGTLSWQSWYPLINVALLAFSVARLQYLD